MLENKKIVSANVGDNSFELILRILGNEFIAIKIGSTNFSGKLIAGGILLLFFCRHRLHNHPPPVVHCRKFEK